MRLVIGYALDLVCRASGHRWCCTWVGRTSHRFLNGGK